MAGESGDPGGGEVGLVLASGTACPLAGGTVLVAAAGTGQASERRSAWRGNSAAAEGARLRMAERKAGPQSAARGGAQWGPVEPPARACGTSERRRGRLRGGAGRAGETICTCMLITGSACNGAVVAAGGDSLGGEPLDAEDLGRGVSWPWATGRTTHSGRLSLWRPYAGPGSEAVAHGGRSAGRGGGQARKHCVGGSWWGVRGSKASEGGLAGLRRLVAGRIWVGEARPGLGAADCGTVCLR